MVGGPQSGFAGWGTERAAPSRNDESMNPCDGFTLFASVRASRGQAISEPREDESDRERGDAAAGQPSEGLEARLVDYGGTVLVVLNGLRLLGYKYKPVNL